MQDDLPDISDGPDGIKGRVAQLEATVKLEAGLRAGMDRELGTISSKLSAHQKSLNALQEVQGDHTRRLTRIEDKLTGVEEDVASVKGDLVTVKVGMHAILDLLDANLAKKSLAGKLAGRFTRRRDGDSGHG